MGTLDLDKARAARAEALKEQHTFVFGGVTFGLPPELPYEFALRLVHGDSGGAMEMLLGGRYDEFIGLHPTVPDVHELAAGVARLYGFGDVGESEASAPSSPNGGKRLRPTSPATTERTSGKPATALRAT